MTRKYMTSNVSKLLNPQIANHRQESNWIILTKTNYTFWGSQTSNYSAKLHRHCVVVWSRKDPFLSLPTLRYMSIIYVNNMLQVSRKTQVASYADDANVLVSWRDNLSLETNKPSASLR